MMEQMSYYPAPSKHECASDMLQLLKRKNDLNILKLYSDEQLLKKINTFLEPIPHDQFGSYAGWIVGGKEMFINDFINKYLRRELRKKIIICKLRVIGRFIALFKNTLETLYAPGSAYERSIKFKYKHLFKTTSETFSSASEDEENDYGYFISVKTPGPAPPPPPSLNKQLHIKSKFITNK